MGQIPATFNAKSEEGQIAACAGDAAVRADAWSVGPATDHAGTGATAQRYPTKACPIPQHANRPTSHALPEPEHLL